MQSNVEIPKIIYNYNGKKEDEHIMKFRFDVDKTFKQ